MDYFMFEIVYIFIPSVVLILSFVWYRDWEQRKTPPGPYGLPIVGSLLSLDSQQPYLTLQALSKKYGPVYRLRLGQIEAVVLSHHDVIKATLSQESSSGKAPLYMTHGIMKGQGVICAEGELWREQRKFMVGVMRSLGMKGCSARAKLEKKILATAVEAAQDLGRANHPTLVDPSPVLLHSIGNIMNLLIFGITYSKDDPIWLRLQYLLDEGSKLIGVSGAINFLPWMRFFPRYRETLRFLKENQVKSHAIYQEIVDEYLDFMKEESPDITSEDRPPEHFMEAYLKERERRLLEGSEGSFTLKQFHFMAADVFGAGTETAHTTIRWLLLDLGNNLECQELVFQEVKSVLEAKGQVSMDDSADLIYTQAFLMESQRHHPAVPLGAPHGTIQDMKIGGYDIPRGTMVIPLLCEVLLKEENWEKSKDFNPMRFIDEETNQILRPATFIPFQIGRRVCPGEDYARMALLIYMVQIVLRYKIYLPKVYMEEQQKGDFVKGNLSEKHHQGLDESRSDDFEESLRLNSLDNPFDNPICGFTMVPRPYKLIFVPRS